MTKPKVLFINPTQTFYPGSQADYSKKLPPIGLVSVAAFIRTKGFVVDVIDALRPDKESQIEDGAIRLGMTEADLIEALSKKKPDVIAISNLFTAQFLNVVFVAKVSKTVFPEVPVVVGGGHASVAAESILESYEDIDIVCCGEGEFTFTELLDQFNGNYFKNLESIEGIAYRGAGSNPIKTSKRAWIKDLDILPFPAYELVDFDYYLSIPNPHRSKGMSNALSLLSSRGCPFKCNFCSIHLHMGRPFRTYSADYIVNHLKYVLQTYNVKHISFEDDNFTANLKRAKEILRKVIGEKLIFTWDTPNGIRADLIDEEFLQLAKKTGVSSLTIGVESGSQDVLDKIIKKALKLEDVVEASRLCKKYKIPLSAFFIIGFPGETIDNMRQTIAFKNYLYDKFYVSSGMSIATPLLGTALYDEVNEKNLWVKENPTPQDFAQASQGSGNSLIKTDLWGVDDITEMQNLDEETQKRIRTKHIFTRPGYSIKRFWRSEDKLRKSWRRGRELISVLWRQSSRVKSS